MSEYLTINHHPKHYLDGCNSVSFPLSRLNCLSEFKTELEKATARRNLGIADAWNLWWQNIQGKVEDNLELADYISRIVTEHNQVVSESLREEFALLSEDINTEITNNIIPIREDVNNMMSNLVWQEYS